MLTDDSIMSFGKYAGEKMANVPATYLLWLDEQWKENPPRNKDGRDVWRKRLALTNNK